MPAQNDDTAGQSNKVESEMSYLLLQAGPPGPSLKPLAANLKGTCVDLAAGECIIATATYIRDYGSWFKQDDMVIIVLSDSRM